MRETSLTLRAVLNSSMSISLSSPAMLSNCLVTQSSHRASASTLMVSGSAEKEEGKNEEDEEDNQKMKEGESEEKEVMRTRYGSVSLLQRSRGRSHSCGILQRLTVSTWTPTSAEN